MKMVNVVAGLVVEEVKLLTPATATLCVLNKMDYSLTQLIAKNGYTAQTMSHTLKDAPIILTSIHCRKLAIGQQRRHASQTWNLMVAKSQ